MRFETRMCSIDELYLDEGNYRFNSATDQATCIRKIHTANPSSFNTLMESLAKDDLGELLLVFDDAINQKKIVMDGNRRLSALKVLHNPELAPTAALEKKAEILKTQCRVNFSRLGVQISDDRHTIMRTVYERHAASGGLRRQDWSALAAARFRYVEDDTDMDWRVTCLLLEAERQHNEISEFIDGNFSYEVFKRVVKSVLSKGYINTQIFKSDERGMKVRPKVLYEHTLSTALKILKDMEEKKLSLSRKDKESYADSETIEKYLTTLSKPPEVAELNPKNMGTESKAAKPLAPNTKNGAVKEQASGASKAQPEQVAPVITDTKKDDKVAKATVFMEKKLERSPETVAALNALGNKKLSALYNSVTDLNVISHVALVHVGCWTLFEVVSVALGKGKDTTSSTLGFINGKLNSFFNGKEHKALRQDLSASVELFVDKGNATKHTVDYIPDPQALIAHFSNADFVLQNMVEDLVKNKPKDD